MGGSGKRILISGAGIAGPTLAWWLHHFGFEPSIVEIAPEFRTGGYVIDFWGKGFDLVERMKLLPQVEQAGYHLQEVRLVRGDGSRAGGFSVRPFYRATGGRFLSIPRGDLASIIWNALPPSVETRFGDQIAAIEPRPDDVEVTFASGKAAAFDFVIGADGLHSRVRELAFGPQDRFEKYLGYAFAAFTVEGYEPRNPDVYTMYGTPGRQLARFAMRGERTLMLFLWSEDDPALPYDDAGMRALLRSRFGDAGWEAQAMLRACDGASDLYVDRMSQILMPQWWAGRVALTGDAAWAPSFLAGEGSGLAIIGAYVMAGELARSGGDPIAFDRYDKRLRSFIDSKQKMAPHLGGAFVPKTRFGVGLRNLLASSFNNPLIAHAALGAGLKDKIVLPDYP